MSINSVWVKWPAAHLVRNHPTPSSNTPNSPHQSSVTSRLLLAKGNGGQNHCLCSSKASSRYQGEGKKAMWQMHQQTISRTGQPRASPTPTDSKTSVVCRWCHLHGGISGVPASSAVNKWKKCLLGISKYFEKIRDGKLRYKYPCCLQ